MFKNVICGDINCLRVLFILYLRSMIFQMFSPKVNSTSYCITFYSNIAVVYYYYLI